MKCKELIINLHHILDRKIKCDYFVMGTSHGCKEKGLQKDGEQFLEYNHEFLGN